MIEYLSWILVLAMLVLVTLFDERTGKIPFLPVSLAFTIGVLIKIWHSSIGDDWLIFGGIQLAFILGILFIPERYIGGGDLKIYSAVYALIPNYHFLLVLIFISYLIAAIDSKIKKKKYLLFAKYILMSYIILFISFIISYT